jgi:MscS family membrane protein
VHLTSNNIDDYFYESLVPPLRVLPIILVFILISAINSSDEISIFLGRLNQSLVSIFIFWFLHQSISIISHAFVKLEEILSKALVLWLINSLKYLFVFLGFVAVLETWGIKIGPIIAGLGLFGVAVALGAQDLFKNLISGIMIISEKRFELNDVISIPGHAEGTVEHIGFRSTLIRQFDTSPIAIPNYIFAEAPILNYSKRSNRRISWTIGLEYNSSIDLIRNLTNSIQEYLIKNDNFIVNETYKSFVRLDKFNDSSIDILIYCFTSTNDWEKFLYIKESLAIMIKNKVDELGLKFAFPSQSIYIEKN